VMGIPWAIDRGTMAIECKNRNPPQSIGKLFKLRGINVFFMFKKRILFV
jgi:hypothetical protein